MRYGFFETGSVLPMSICILVRWVVPIFVSSCANCDLNVSSIWLSVSSHLWVGYVCKRVVKESGWTCSSIIFCMVRLLIVVCNRWSMDGSVRPMHCPLLNVTCLCDSGSHHCPRYTGELTSHLCWAWLAGYLGYAQGLNNNTPTIGTIFIEIITGRLYIITSHYTSYTAG